MTSPEELVALAVHHLPAEAAARWVSLLRPAVRLAVADESGGPVVGALGGDPELPADVEWPVWQGNGPLSFVASLDCAALPGGELDIALPEDGTLLFFYFDGQFDDGAALVYCGEADSMAGARVIYVPAGTPVETRPAPEGLKPFPRLTFTAEVVATAPPSDHWLVEGAELGGGGTPAELKGAVDFEEELADIMASHQVGGHAFPIQGPVEYEVAVTALGGGELWSDPRLGTEAARWILLAQIDSEGDMMWGDVGILYWLIKPEDLAARRFENALFTWQCS